jgi:hypothetical protein
MLPVVNILYLFTQIQNYHMQLRVHATKKSKDQVLQNTVS